MRDEARPCAPMCLCSQQAATQTVVPNLSKAVAPRNFPLTGFSDAAFENESFGLSTADSMQYSGFGKREMMQMRVFLQVKMLLRWRCAYCCRRKLHAWQAAHAEAQYNAVAGTSRAIASARHRLQAQLTHQTNTANLFDAVLAGST
jgi:hypothetical protein